MSRKFSLKAVAAASCLALAGFANAAIIGAGTPIPDANVLLNFAGSGLDWVYAGPIAPGEFGAGEIEFPSFRAAEGWRTATALEWAAHPAWDAFIIGAPFPPSNGFTDHSIYRFAPEYWSSFRHVDQGDFAAGRVTDGVNGVVSGVPETIYVRNTRLPIPEPGTLALLGVSLFGLLAVAKRRQSS